MGCTLQLTYETNKALWSYRLSLWPLNADVKNEGATVRGGALLVHHFLTHRVTSGQKYVCYSEPLVKTISTEIPHSKDLFLCNVAL